MLPCLERGRRCAEERMRVHVCGSSRVWRGRPAEAPDGVILYCRRSDLAAEKCFAVANEAPRSVDL